MFLIFMKWSVEILLHNQLTHWYSGVKLFGSLENTTGFHVQNTGQCLTVINILIYLYVTGQPEVFKNTSGRIVNLTSYMTSLVLMAAYSAFLISSLAVQRHDLPFRDLQGLLHDGSYRLGVLRDGYEFNMFEVCGRKYLWPDYLLLVILGLWEKFERGGNMAHLPCFI